MGHAGHNKQSQVQPETDIPNFEFDEKKDFLFCKKKKKIQTKIKTNNNLIDELTCPFQYSIYRDADSYRLVM